MKRLRTEITSLKAFRQAKSKDSIASSVDHNDEAKRMGVMLS